MKGEVRKSIRYSIIDGVCWANMVGFVDPYIVPFALKLGANNFFIGILRSIPPLLSSFSQIFSEYLVWRVKRCREVIYYFVLIQAISVLIASFTSIIPSDYKFISRYIFLLSIILYNYAGSTATAPWFTLMGEYIPSNKRGVFFGKRTQIVGVFYFISSFLAGYILKKNPDSNITFFILFLIASFFRFCSAYYINKMYEPSTYFHIPSKPSLEDYFDFRIDKKIKKVYKSIFILLFSVYIAAPYFSVYVLKELKFDYIRYMFLVSFGQVLTWFSARWWGKLNDRYGSLKILGFGMIFIPFISLFWMLTKNFYILFLVEIFSGIMWGAFGIVYNTFVYEYVKPSERTRYTSYLIFFMSVAQFLGSIIGGIIYDKVKLEGVSTFLIILGISTIGRFIAFFYFKKIYKKYFNLDNSEKFLV